MAAIRSCGVAAVRSVASGLMVHIISVFGWPSVSTPLLRTLDTVRWITEIERRNSDFSELDLQLQVMLRSSC
jgi:hypothetical protein